MKLSELFVDVSRTMLDTHEGLWDHFVANTLDPEIQDDVVDEGGNEVVYNHVKYVLDYYNEYFLRCSSSVITQILSKTLDCDIDVDLQNPEVVEKLEAAIHN